jgi:hypothetical protein
MAVRLVAASQKPKCRKKECIRPRDSKGQGDSHNLLVRTERVSGFLLVWRIATTTTTGNDLGGAKECRRRWKQQVCDDLRGSCGGAQNLLLFLARHKGFRLRLLRAAKMRCSGVERRRLGAGSTHLRHIRSGFVWARWGLLGRQDPTTGRRLFFVFFSLNPFLLTSIMPQNIGSFLLPLSVEPDPPNLGQNTQDYGDADAPCLLSLRRIQTLNQSNSLASVPFKTGKIALSIFPQKIGGAAELGKRPCSRWILSRRPLKWETCRLRGVAPLRRVPSTTTNNEWYHL